MPDLNCPYHSKPPEEFTVNEVPLKIENTVPEPVYEGPIFSTQYLIINNMQFQVNYGEILLQKNILYN
jgi:hypothetical protein